MIALSFCIDVNNLHTAEKFQKRYPKDKEVTEKKWETMHNRSACIYEVQYLNRDKFIIGFIPLMLNIHFSLTKQLCILIAPHKKTTKDCVLNGNSMLSNGKIQRL